MSCMYSDLNEWNNYIVIEMHALFDEYSNDVELSDLGFPKNWENLLTQPSGRNIQPNIK